VVIAVVLAVGLILNKVNGAAPVTDHPKSTNSTASVSDGVITVTGGTPKVTVDLFEDGICPACRDFEAQYGQQIMKAVDEGKLTVRYHFLNFLNPNSPSKDYSTRAAAAFECVAAVPAAAAPEGLFMNFHTTMFSAGTQPAEGGTTDLSNQQIAEIAVKAGAPASAATCITSGVNIPQAKTTAAASQAILHKAVNGDGWGTPTGMKDGALLSLNDTSWLSNLLG
jgi:protein-disulfide isomerase